ncbi:MAG TPA: S8 family serine peptidase [Candidatus Cryosericum sp.]|nr:S8 family serine peptidase [Candidatus Cryosericum sp.]
MLPLLVLLVLALAPSGSSRAANGGDGGTIPLLIQSRVQLTPDVIAAIGSHVVHVTYTWPEINAMAVTVNPSKFAELISNPLVGLVETDSQGQVPGDSAEAASGVAAPTVVVPLPESSTTIQTWNQDMTDTQGSGFDGMGVTVAVVDSGLPQNWEEFLPPGVRVDTEHAVGFGAEGWGDFHSTVKAVRGTGGHIGLFPHGLAVSSVIVGFPSELGPIGGAAPGVTILPIRVINQFNFGWFSWFTAGIMHVGRLKAEGALSGPVVINFSIQAHNDSVILKSAIDYAISQGVLFVTIAGNFGPADGSIAFPGRLPESITAGAVGWTKEGCLPPVCTTPWFFADVPENDPAQVYVATFSGREASPPPSPRAIDVLAPGSFVFGEWLFGPGFSEGREVAFDAVDNFIFGTSFAAPHVVGIVAQMLQKNPGLTQSQAEAILKSTALAIPASPAGLSTPFQFVYPWGANATGSGLARGTAAVAATP